MASREVWRPIPEARTTKGVFVIDRSVAELLRELEEKLAHELLDSEEREELVDRIKRLRLLAESEAVGAR